jgi:3-oxoacyl-[acyl-carrier-protein] synthase III
MYHAAITGWGMYVPEHVLTNDDLAKVMDTSDEWIRTRTGIRERRTAAATETTTSMATAAGIAACKCAGIDPAELELVVVATFTPDQYMPSTASSVQHAIGASRAAAFDMNTACSGFVYALATGAQFVQSGTYSKVLVIGADFVSRFLDYTDRGTAILFGDGAGAVVLERSDADEGVLAIELGSNGAAGQHLTLGDPESFVGLNGSRSIDRPFMKMNGPEVFRFAVRIMGEAAASAILKAGLTFADIDLLIPHQANLRIIEAAAKRLELPRDRVWVNVDRYANTSCASIPICLVEAEQEGALTDGKHVAVIGFGGGLTWAAAVIRWGAGGVKREDAT